MVNFECKSAYDMGDFRKIIEILRAPGGCPWDIEQTHESIRRNLLEEAYEVCEAIDQKDPEHLREELGDLMLQIIFHTRIEEENGSFDLDSVADGACKKLIYRHPHVFGNIDVSGSEEVIKNWDELKRREKSQTTVTKTMTDVAESLPALWRAEKIQKKAKKVGFDWPDSDGAMSKLSEELQELVEALAEGDKAHVEEELGDLLFAAVNVARFSNIDPEQALHNSCDKFISRFGFIETEAQRSGRDMKDMSLEELDALYNESKQKK
ncbi:MAG: nucleoside triphosphate pyrophosphohydrolase [Oscillospiraceae bacterium]|nr:nucleoside triphosphate pyrophosphohydrolase [Oscillospiraceae bacterium]